MGNCFSGGGHGHHAVGGTSSFPDNGGLNDAVDHFFKTRGFNNDLVNQIELSLSASKLCDRDVLSKSDPMAVVYTKGKDGSLQEIGRTEVVLNSLNPQWITKVKVAYYFETVQTLVFRVYDVDTQLNVPEVKTIKLDDQDYLGEAICTLSQIVTNRKWTIDLVTIAESTEQNHKKNLGQITVYAEEVVVSKIAAELKFKCSNLENKDFFSKSDPFLVISKLVEGGATVPVCRTEVLKNNLKPEWKPVHLNVSQVGSKDTPLMIECFNYNSNGKHDLLGKVQKSLAQLEKLSASTEGESFFVTTTSKDNPTKRLKSQLFVETYSESVHHTFLDYFLGGCELNFMVAIDFTASNGNPRLPDSLHYIDYSGRPNEYQKAIQAVGGVLQYYDYDKQFPSWGFGARPFDGPVSHCFSLNGNDANPSVEGIQGMMSAYERALSNVSLAGPTLFGPVITSAATIAAQSMAAKEHKYYVLLIITDGVITDLEETKDALVKASDLPLSILIVGVGGADFKEMEILDADKGEKLQSSTGRVQSRDIVQFVPFREVQAGVETSVVQSLLAELPTQFLTYMRNNGIQPKEKLPTTS